MYRKELFITSNIKISGHSNLSYSSTSFIKVPNGLYALNRKVGSSLVCLSILKWSNPIEYNNLKNKYTDLSNIQSHSKLKLQNIQYNSNEIIYLLVREPISRFISACNETHITDIDKKLDSLEKRLSNDPHFKLQSSFYLYSNNIKNYLFPEELNSFFIDTGLEDINVISNKKLYNIILTNQQIERIKKIYNDDINLYEKMINKLNGNIIT